MLRSYSFAKTATKTADDSAFRSAVMLTNVDEILSATQSKVFSFLKDSELTKALTAKYRTAEKISVSIDYTTNGTKVNKVRVKFPNSDNLFNVSIFGAEKALKPAGEFDAETVKKCIFGVCQSAGETVGSKGFDKEGNPVLIPTVYVVFPEDVNKI